MRSGERFYVGIVTLIVLLVNVVWMCGAAYVIAHFIRKFW